MINQTIEKKSKNDLLSQIIEPEREKTSNKESKNENISNGVSKIAIVIIVIFCVVIFSICVIIFLFKRGYFKKNNSNTNCNHPIETQGFLLNTKETELKTEASFP